MCTGSSQSSARVHRLLYQSSLLSYFFRAWYFNPTFNPKAAKTMQKPVSIQMLYTCPNIIVDKMTFKHCRTTIIVAKIKGPCTRMVVKINHWPVALVRPKMPAWIKNSGWRFAKPIAGVNWPFAMTVNANINDENELAANIICKDVLLYVLKI